MGNNEHPSLRPFVNYHLQFLKVVILPASVIPEKEQYILDCEMRGNFTGHQAPVTQQLRSNTHTKSVWGLTYKQAKGKWGDITICSSCVYLQAPRSKCVTMSYASQIFSCIRLH